MTRTVLTASLLVLLMAACSPAAPVPEPDAAPHGATASPRAGQTPDQTAATAAAASGRRYEYTALDDCKVVKEEREEMPYIERECLGPAGWSLRIADSDARQRLTVIAPDGSARPIDLTKLTGGAFSAFRGSAEWRGPAEGPFAPDSLIIRHDFAADPPPMPERSVLVVVRLKPSPCFVTAVPPGEGQNADARAVADRGGLCVD